MALPGCRQRTSHLLWCACLLLTSFLLHRKARLPAGTRDLTAALLPPSAERALPYRRTSLIAAIAGSSIDTLVGVISSRKARALDGRSELEKRTSTNVLSWKPFGGKVDPFGDGIVYPQWLEGTWQADYKQKDVQFPQGYAVFGSDIPLVIISAVLSRSPIAVVRAVRAPTVFLVGNEDYSMNPPPAWRFLAADACGTRAEWTFILPSLLQSFSTKRTSVRATKGSVGSQEGIVLTYTASNGQAQNITLVWLAADTSRTDPDGSFESVEWIRQIDPAGIDGVCEYKVLTKFVRADKPGFVKGSLQLAAFLQPVDPGYIEAGGKAVAVCSYDFTLQRVS